jgi:Protein of unknown function DUF262
MTDFLNTTHRTVLQLRKWLDAAELELKPPYQRNPVWLEPQKAALIDTILRGYPIPEIYMQDIVTTAGEEMHYVVDGQQRIRACLEFVEGNYTLDPDVSPEHGEVYFEDLDDADKKAVWGYRFLVRLLPDIPDTETRAIFKRLNQNVVSLNKQELRHSTYWGPFIKTMEDLADDEFWAESGVFSANDFRRMLDVEFVSELAIALLHGPQNKKDRLDDWYALYERGFERRAEIERTFRAVTGELEQVLPNLRRTRWRNRSDFYTLFWVLAQHEDELPLARDQREELTARLTRFGDAVSGMLSKDRRLSRKKTVREYVQAVERAATDVSNRIARTEALQRELKAVFA